MKAEEKPRAGVELAGGVRRLERDWLAGYPRELIDALVDAARSLAVDIHVVGGTVRDWLLGVKAHDLDLAVSGDALVFAGHLARQLNAAFVPLDEDEGVARVVWGDLTIDCAGYRGSSRSIGEDLQKRDFTINALAVGFDSERGGLVEDLGILDPTGGLADLAGRVIRAPGPEVFRADPLRMLRAYRFGAVLDFWVAPETLALIERDRDQITRASAERLTYELDLIMASARAHQTMAAMVACGLLWRIVPELQAGLGQTQPASHHLDVFAHNLAALAAMEEILGEPGRFFPARGQMFEKYCAVGRRRVWLKWAALLHDLGKPATRHVRPDGRITFYNHDRAGADQVLDLSRRLKWSREDSRRVARLVELHMWPFHLSNTRRKTGITARACLKLIKAIGEDLPGLFLLAMADSLAGQGPGKPAGMEAALAALHAEVDQVYCRSIKPVLDMPRLVSGHDLIAVFGLAPGPEFREILEALEQAQVEGLVAGRDQALGWVASYLEGRGQGTGGRGQQGKT